MARDREPNSAYRGIFGFLFAFSIRTNGKNLNFKTSACRASFSGSNGYIELDFLGS